MSDFNYRGKLPFRIVSSSVNTGYNAELTSSVGRNIEVVNQHSDEYSELQDSPMQGPFTQQWVGGNQHRHNDLNKGSDDPTNRPEAFLISGSANKIRVYGPAHFDETAPKAVLTREEVAKRPLNIKNIATVDGRLGNFSHNYQVVQTSGRDINQSLIQNDLTASGVLTTKFIEGVEEYTLPDLTNNKNKSVFVERFSAPGDKKESSRGVLDRESEQYSPNNSLITRNIGVRQPYYNQLTKHNGKFYIDAAGNALLDPYGIEDLGEINKLDNFDVSSIFTQVFGVYFRDDGLKMYINGASSILSSKFVAEFSLLSPYDVTTSVFVATKGLSGLNKASIDFKPDGTRMFLLNSTSKVEEYILSVPWDITTATFNSPSTSLSPLIQTMRFREDGLKLYGIRNLTVDTIIEYTLSNAWDLSTISAGLVKATISQSTFLTGFVFDTAGKNLLFVDRSTNKLYFYNLLYAWDLTSITLQKTVLFPPYCSLRDVHLSIDSKKCFIIDELANTVYLYNLEFLPSENGKVNSNSKKVIKDFYGTYATSSLNDNFWVQHSIPRTDLRYKWIADSYVPSLTSPFFEYQRLGIDSEEIIFNSSSFVISGSNKRFAVDNIGINSLVKDKKSIDITNNIFTITNPSLSASYSEIANTPYGFSTWKQLRTGEHPIARKLRENNVVSIEDSKSKVINGIQQSSRYSDNVRQYTEPPVTSKFKPLQQTLELKANNENYVFTYTHGNNLSSFVNTEIVDRLGINENSQQMHDLLRKYYIAQNRKNDPKNPFNQLVNYKYSETLYPREVNAYMAETRGRTQYILDQAGTGSRDGFDIQLGTQRAFWRDRLEDRIRTEFISRNSMNYQARSFNISLLSGIPTCIELPGYGGYTGREWINIEINSSRNRDESSVHTFDNSPNMTALYGQTSLYLDGIFITGAAGEENTGSLQINNQMRTNGQIGEINKEIFLNYFYSCSIDYISDDDENNLPTYVSGTKKQLTVVTPHSALLQHIPELETSLFVKYVFPTTYPSYSTITESLPTPRPNYVAFLGGFESGSRNFSDYMSDIFDSKPTGEILSTLDSGLRYATESFGDKKPWFDTYEDYIDDIRPLAKDHSILPEFRISSNMPYYVTDKGGNFRSPNKAFLEIDGIGQNYRSAAIPQLQVYNQNFINSYVTTDAADYSTQLESDNRPVSKPESIKFAISGIKKLLPYNGFYPQDRTVQLANLFNDFLEQNVGGGYSSIFKVFNQINTPPTGNITSVLIYNSDDSNKYWSKNVVMPYFFSPGILYNTIKSGISVDFPAITASISDIRLADFVGEESAAMSVSEVNTLKKCSMLAKKYEVLEDNITIDPYEFEASYIPENKINTRVPFENIIFPQNFITKPLVITSSFITANDVDVTLSSSQQLALEEKYAKYISNSISNIKFDCNHQPDRYHQPLYGLGTAPSIQPDFINLGLYQKNASPFAYMKNDSIIDPSYSMAMSNFLAEIPTFFLKQQSAEKDQHLNVFRSSELKDWKPFQIGKKYYLDIKMKKSSDLVLMEAYRSDYHITGTNNIEKTFNGRYFGWPVSKVSGSRTINDDYVVHNDPAYAPFTPPYFEGEAILRFELSAASASYNTVRELFNDLRLTDIFNELGQSAHTASEAYLNKMSIQDCMEVFGIGANPVPTFEANGTARSQDGTPNTQTQYWAISPKLETPVLDFSDQEFVAHTGSYWVSSGYGRGMWSGYGKIPTGSKGITIEMAESFPLQNSGRFNNFTNPVNPKLTGSLLDQVGFKAQSSKIGQLAETKDISEAIVAIPYVDKPITGVTTFIDGHHFIAINRNIYAELKSAIEIGTTLNIPGQPAGYESSVTKMIKSMNNYVIPPNFNFSKYGNIDPFVMYLFEFKHTLDQQDLADIWQGVMPKIAYKAEEDQVVIEHKFGPYEMFGENFSTPENLRWMIFKVKKKAEWNYFAITENIGDDNRFKFNFANSQEAKTPDYSYNWPYDYFSLVELAKVDITMEYSGSQTIPEGNLVDNQQQRELRRSLSEIEQLTTSAFTRQLNSENT